MSKIAPLLARDQAAPETTSTAEPGGVTQERLFLVILTAVFLVAAEARVIAPMLPAIAQDFQTTAARTGLLITLYTLPYGLFQLVYGPLADRFSRQRVMGVALGLFAIGTLLSGFAPTFWLLDVLRFGTGAAAAGIIPVALAYVGDMVPYGERQGALGRVVSVSALGGVLSAALGGVIATVLSWRAMFIGYGVLSLLVAALLLRLPPVRLRTGARNAPGFFKPYVAIFQVGGTAAVALYLLVFLEGLTAMSTMGYLGALLFERDHLSYATIGGLLTLSGISTLWTGRRVGALVQRLGERGMLLVGGTLLTVGYLLVGLQPWPIFFPVSMLISGAGFVIAHSTLQTRATELVPTQRATAVALFAFALFLGGGLGTYLAGWGIDSVGYGWTLNATAGGLAVFTAASWPLLGVMQRGR